jgi:predicted porin
VSFAWRHWQVWGEVHAARFEVPGVGDADTLAYFVEAKYKVTPQLSTALRWNQQTFDRITTRSGQRLRWGREVWRVDFGPTYRFSPHIQLKLQLSLRHENPAVSTYTHSVGTQLTVRF